SPTRARNAAAAAIRRAIRRPPVADDDPLSLTRRRGANNARTAPTTPRTMFASLRAPARFTQLPRPTGPARKLQLNSRPADIIHRLRKVRREPPGRTDMKRIVWLVLIVASVGATAAGAGPFRSRTVSRGQSPVQSSAPV